ncbi:helix-turn-helix transcriptional regulator [Fibrella sp. HMF5335]|uniref:Helix-turn-helix transcriptional regulator n=1 Tax=Fibrella rubiginis TaxID=2817060 RepID=A0A939K0D2_9BACT|nr:helix-turn-helix transcriptional regulator [Fibrella rubiginis]MBO0935962.1 helix-turn-helix transcriptional regulator [Fibrella rubiginis]
MSINDKIKQVLLTKNLSPSYLADDIGVQRSSISHILSGRNRPSLDIIQKIVRRFPEFNYEWFLDDDVQLLTEQAPTADSTAGRLDVTRGQTRTERPLVAPSDINTERSASVNRPNVPKPIAVSEGSLQQSADVSPIAGKQIDRILIFYTDGTFREYTPA